MTNPTLGPWKTDYDPDAFAPTIVVMAASGIPVAEVLYADRHPVPTSTDEALANARLMSKSWEMLAELKRLVGDAITQTIIDDAEGR